MIIKKLYEYKELTREVIDGKRHYAIPGGHRVPSVTTVLDVTKPQESRDALAAWRRAVGEEKARQITSEAASVGTTMHSYLEHHCNGTPKAPGSNLVHKIAYPMAQVIVHSGLSKLQECWGNELPLYFPGLYSGTTDGFGMWCGRSAIYDFKQTNKPKKDEHVEDYKIQLAAYIEAHDEVYGTKIEQGVIMMCSRDLQYQEWVITGSELDRYKQLWWDRVDQYYATKQRY